MFLHMPVLGSGSSESSVARLPLQANTRIYIRVPNLIPNSDVVNCGYYLVITRCRHHRKHSFDLCTDAVAIVLTVVSLLTFMMHICLIPRRRITLKYKNCIDG